MLLLLAVLTVVVLVIVGINVLSPDARYPDADPL
jgi:hypothetical protein